MSKVNKKVQAALDAANAKKIKEAEEAAILENRKFWAEGYIVPIIGAFFVKERILADFPGAAMHYRETYDGRDCKKSRGSSLQVYGYVFGVHCAELDKYVTPSMRVYVDGLSDVNDDVHLVMRIGGDMDGGLLGGTQKPYAIRLPEMSRMEPLILDILEKLYEYWLETMYDDKLYVNRHRLANPSGATKENYGVGLDLSTWAEKHGFDALKIED